MISYLSFETHLKGLMRHLTDNEDGSSVTEQMLERDFNYNTAEMASENSSGEHNQWKYHTISNHSMLVHNAGRKDGGIVM